MANLKKERKLKNEYTAVSRQEMDCCFLAVQLCENLAALVPICSQW